MPNTPPEIVFLNKKIKIKIKNKKQKDTKSMLKENQLEHPD